MAKPTIYDLLSKLSISDITQSQLNTATSNSDVDRESVEFWKGPIILQRVLEMRCYPNGLPVPELSSIEVLTVPDGQTGVFKPSGTEIYEIMAINSDAAVVLGLFDDTTNLALTDASADVFLPASPLYITNSLYISVANGSGGATQTKIAYHQVGL